MTVVFDLLGVQNRDHGERGIARYVANLALAIESEFPSLVDHYLIHTDLPVPGSISPLLASGKVLRSDDTTHPALSPTSGGVFFCGSVFELEQSLSRVLPPWARTVHWKRVAILYDLIPLRFASHYLSDPKLKLRYQTRVQSLKMFDQLLAISEATATDAVELAEIGLNNISSIGAGADEQFRRPSVSRAEAASRLVASGRYNHLRPGFILFPTGFDFRKNIDGFLSAYAALPQGVRRRHQLVMMCGLNEDQRAYMGELMAKLGLGPDELILTGRVSDRELVELNQTAELVVFPSIYEGFGLPVLEARQCGAAVLCGDNSSLREVQPDPRARFDAGSRASMTAALSRVLSTPGELERLRSAEVPQFSWADSASGAESVIAKLKKSVVPAPLPRLAVISPMPPLQSGIATYATRLIEHLRHYCDITVFTEVKDPDDAESTSDMLARPPDGVTLRPLSQLAPTIAGGGSFDELLYFMGNSRFHVESLIALRAHPGAVLFHDVRMTGLYNECVRLGAAGVESVGDELARMYPGRYRPALENSKVISPEDAARFGVLMCADIANTATRVLVHSDYAATLIDLDASVKAEVCFPLPAPQVESIPRGDSAHVINSFGVVDPAKMPKTIIEAVSVVRDVVPEVTLNFIGPIDPEYRRELESITSELGVGDAVAFTGHMTQVEFGAAQRSTTIAVQLRASSNGESSAAVAELLAAGIPTVVSDLGSMSDLPAEVVVKLPLSNSSSELARIILDLIREPKAREALTQRAQAWADKNSFEVAAAKLAQALFEKTSPE